MKKLIRADAAPAVEERLRELGTQATASFRRAIGGMREVLSFYATVKVMQATAEGVDSHDENQPRRGAKGGNVSKPGDLKALFARYAPDVNLKSAYRLMAVGENVAKEYVALVGSKFSQQHELPALVSTPAEQLPPKVRAKQELLFGFIDGTSQKSWLDKFKAPPQLGGARTKGDAPYDPNAPIENARDLLLHPLRQIAMRWAEKEAKLPLWSHLPPAELQEIDGILMELRSDLKAALKKEGK